MESLVESLKNCVLETKEALRSKQIDLLVIEFAAFYAEWGIIARHIGQRAERSCVAHLKQQQQCLQRSRMGHFVFSKTDTTFLVSVENHRPLPIVAR